MWVLPLLESWAWPWLKIKYSAFILSSLALFRNLLILVHRLREQIVTSLLIRPNTNVVRPLLLKTVSFISPLIL